ncbi:MarR family winged helix-turn-helix transcriptional regulator [Rhodovulum strictum]|uniref:MarR family transcriptional regulator n=1 Tax=Rhodovulum strictum TaxID=58314 RepID=A0A844B319_9RHOB|nr:MarR family transcriptional regulator [Rhodovulum strictum]MRH20511.1 MarR family transcriptional regulator [Rhodovulum strictum]
MPFSREASAGYLANHMARLFEKGLARRLVPLGLAPAQFMVLLVLWREDGLTQRDLAERLDVEQATMANTLARMERDGLITRSVDAEDRRARRNHLTERGRALEGPATEAAAAQNAAALAGLTEAERAALIAIAAKVIATMRRG